MRDLINGSNLPTEREGNSNATEREIQLGSDSEINERYFAPQKVEQVTGDSKKSWGKPKGKKLKLEDKVRLRGRSNSEEDTNVLQERIKR